MNRCIKILALLLCVATSFSGKTLAHESFETMALCVSRDHADGRSLKVMESTSSVRAILEIEKVPGPNQKPAEVERFYGVKDDSVRDPIVFQYEFDSYELMISLERRDDGSYPASLTTISPDGDRKDESFFCKL